MTQGASMSSYQLHIILLVAILCVIAPVYSAHSGQRWSRQVHNANGFINLAGSDWVPVQQFPKTRSVEPLATEATRSGARVLNFAPPHLQTQNQFYSQQLHQLPQQQHLQQLPTPQQQQQHQHQQQQHQQLLQMQAHQQHLNAIESRPHPSNGSPFASMADPFQLVNSGPHRFHVQQSPSQLQQFHQAPGLGGHQFVAPPAPISQQSQQFFQQQTPVQTVQSSAPQPLFHYEQQQQLHQHGQQQKLQQQHLPQLPPHLAQTRHQSLILNPAELNQQYQFPQFIQQHPAVGENVQLQAQPLQHVLQQQYEIQQAPPTFTDQRKPQTEALVQRSPPLYGQEPETPKLRPLSSEQPAEEDVQLLYVPLDTLYKQQNEQRLAGSSKAQPQPAQNIKYNVQPVNPSQINNFYTATASTIKPSATPPVSAYPSSPAYVFEGSTQRYVQQQSSTTTPPSKIKPHQPPLAMFMLKSVTNTELSVNEVLHALKNARNIDVLDSASKKSPKVFVGPSGLRTPSGYSKFELPYLSSIEQNRVVNMLPFFVAPLSYKAPKGFAKIPLPAPHVGSVVVNSPPEIVQYQPIDLPVQQQNQRQQPQQQQRTQQSYPKKTQSQVTQSFDQSTAYRTTSNPKYGFMLGSDVFTTTAKSFYTPTPKPSISTIKPNVRQQYVSSTSEAPLRAEQYSQFPEYPANGRNPSTTSAPIIDHSQRYQSSSTDDEPFVPMTSPKPTTRAGAFGRFGQHATPQTNRQPTVTANNIPTTRIPFNYEQFVRPSAQPTQPTYTPSQRPFVSSSQPALSTYSSQQHEDEYSASFLSSTPSTVKSEQTNSLLSFKPNPSPLANVQSEEYFNVQQTPTTKETFANVNKTNSFTSNLYNQFHPSRDYFGVPPVTSSDSTASAPKPTESENYSFQPLIPSEPATPRPEITYTSKPAEQSTRAQEIYNMKNYYREQTAFKSRPQSASGESSGEYNAQAVSKPSYSTFERNTPSPTPQYVYMRSTSTTETPTESSESDYLSNSTPRNTITYYTPSSNYAEDSPKPAAVHNFRFGSSLTGRPEDIRASTESAERDDKRVYSNHRESYSEPAAVPTPSKVRLFEYERSTKASPVNGDVPAYDYSQTQSQNDAYSELIRDSIKQNEAPVDGSSDGEADSNVGTFNLPSELPAISASLPGMVNSLFVDAASQDAAQSDAESAFTTEPTIASTRRTPQRGRRPQTGTRTTVTRAPVTRAPRTTTSTTTASPDDGTDDNIASTRRTTIRNRRPIHYANRTTTLRTPTVRNPNRVRYNPSSEERQRVRNKPGKTSGKDEDLEYQRDVLKQNYPATRSQSAESTTAVSMVHETERYSSHYRSTPADSEDDDRSASSPSPATYTSSDEFSSSTSRSSSEYGAELPQHFSGLADHMQIPQEHQSLIGEYYNSESEISAVEAINNNGLRKNNVDRPVFVSTPQTTSVPLTSASATEDAVQENTIEPQRTRRPSFVRRPVTGGSRPVYGPTSTSTESAERFTVRSKVRNDPNNAPVYTPKPRNSRVRVRPSTTTTTAEPTGESGVDENYQQISRFNKDFYQDAPRNRNFHRTTAKPVVRSNEQKRFKYESFALDTQESQWSTKVSDNSFRPVEESDEYAKTSKSAESEPEIVTAGPIESSENNGEIYLMKVSSSLGGNSDDSSSIEATTTTSPTSTERSTASFVDLLGEAMSELGNEIIGKNNNQAKSPEDITTPTSASIPTTSIPDSAPESSSIVDGSTSGHKRRGVWKRVRVRPSDGFETAESQNYGSRVIYNTIVAGSAKEQLNADGEKRVQLNADDAVASTISTASSPGDVDLGTGAPILGTAPTVANETAVVATPTSKVETTPQPDESDEIVTIIARTDEPRSDAFTTASSTRRYDNDSDDLQMEDDHTELPFPYDPFGDNTDSDPANDGAASTDAPLPTVVATSELPSYDEYDPEYQTARPSASSASGTPAVQTSAPAPTSSLMSDVKHKLSQLFSFGDDYDYADTNAVVRPETNDNGQLAAKHQYTSINRVRATSGVETESAVQKIAPKSTMASSKNALSESRPLSDESAAMIEHPSSTTTEATPTSSSAPPTTAKSFHRNLMDSVIYATSTSTEISHETEICYRGRCIKTEKKLH